MKSENVQVLLALDESKADESIAEMLFMMLSSTFLNAGRTVRIAAF